MSERQIQPPLGAPSVEPARSSSGTAHWSRTTGRPKTAASSTSGPRTCFTAPACSAPAPLSSGRRCHVHAPLLRLVNPNRRLLISLLAVVRRHLWSIASPSAASTCIAAKSAMTCAVRLAIFVKRSEGSRPRSTSAEATVMVILEPEVKSAWVGGGWYEIWG